MSVCVCVTSYAPKPPALVIPLWVLVQIRWAAQTTYSLGRIAAPVRQRMSVGCPVGSKWQKVNKPILMVTPFMANFCSFSWAKWAKWAKLKQSGEKRLWQMFVQPTSGWKKAVNSG